MVVNFTNSTYTASDETRNLTATIISQTQTTITGTVDFPPGAPLGKWDVVVTNPDVSPVSKTGVFTVTDPSKPTISSVNPASRYRGVCSNITLSGTNFWSGITVNFPNSNFLNSDGTRDLTTMIASQTTSQVKGTLVLPGMILTGKWDIVATNPDAPEARKNGTFTVKEKPVFIPSR